MVGAADVARDAVTSGVTKQYRLLSKVKVSAFTQNRYSRQVRSSST
jgi:hypothetical protein